MPKFAVYYIPDQDDPLYRLGSGLLGYDLRTHAFVKMAPTLRKRLGVFDEIWVQEARPYGFHLTIGDAIECTEQSLSLAARDLEGFLRCFHPIHPFTLTRNPELPIEVWGKHASSIIVLPYTPNNALLLFHALVVARINTLGSGSIYTEQLAIHHMPNDLPTYQVEQIRQFYSPYILENWHPHFTLLNPYTGNASHRMMRHLADIFAPFATVTVRSICLMAQDGDGTPWHIFKEFFLT
jgi:hypothetical protein